jgi:hypothetical protein
MRVDTFSIRSGRTAASADVESATDPLPTDLDSPETLVLVFGSSRRSEDSTFGVLRRAFPRSKIVGSTAGKIFGEHVSEDRFAVAIALFGHTRVRQSSMDVASASRSFEAGVDRLVLGASDAATRVFTTANPSAGGKCDLHNQTMTLTLIGEA